MYTVSTQYKEDIKKSYREWDFKATFTYKNSSGTITKELSKDDVIVSSVKVESGCIPGSVFSFGAAISKNFKITIKNDNEEYNNSTINGGTIKPFIGLVLSTGATEWIPLGTFYIYKASKPLKTIKIEASDYMIKFEKKYTPAVTFPCSLKNIMDDICTQAGIELDGDFNNSGYVVNDYTQNGSLYSYRDIIKYIATAAGGYAIITRGNKLKIASFELSSSPYLVDPDVMRISSEYEDIKTFTGLLYRKSNNNKMYGEDTTPIIIQNNVLLDNLADGDLSELLEGLYNKYLGFSYIPCNVEMRCDPCLDEGDTLSFNKTTDGTVKSFIGEYSFSLAGKYMIKSPGTSELDSDFLINKYDRENQSNGGTTIITPEKKINENLLLTSLFIKPFFPRNYVQQSTAYPIESLQLDMLTTSSGVSSGLAKVWLPFQDLEPDTTYTFSVLLRSYSNKNQKLALTMINYTNGADIFQVVGKDNLPLDTAMSEVVKGTSSWLNTGVAFNFGEIQLTDTLWNWHTLTFTTPSTDVLAYDIQNYILCLGVNQATTTLGNTYKVFIQKAKLEKGSEATEWCLGKGESIEGNFIYEEQNGIKLIKKTNTAVAKSNVSDYESRTLHLMPSIRLYDALHGVTQICYQERRSITGDTGGTDEIVPEISFCTNTNFYGSANIARLFMDENKAIRIVAPGGLFLNDTQIS